MSETSEPTVLIVLDSTFSARDLVLRGPSLRDAAVASLALPKGDFVDALRDAEPRIEPALVQALVRLDALFSHLTAPRGRNPYVAPKRRAPKTIGRPPRR